MNLKKKLTVSFIILTIIPLLMIVFVTKLIITYQLSSIEQIYDVESDTLQLIADPIKILNRLTRRTFNFITYTAKTNPEKFEDEDYIRELNNEISGKYSFLVLRIEDEIVFSGNSNKMKYIERLLPEYSGYATSVDGGMYVSGEFPALIKQQDFISTKGEKGTIFIVTDAMTIIPELRLTAVQAVVAFVVILIFCSSILVVWLYRGIVIPINKLRKATGEIISGNLDYSVSMDGTDEIGGLCRDFEQMRLHLKETTGVRIQYEQNQKDLLSNISHDLKTPLTTIKGYAEGMIDGVAGSPEKREKYLKTIYNKACDMTVLVDELSLYTQLDCNNLPYNFENLRVSSYFGDCIDELKDELEIKGMTLIYKSNVPENTKIIADPEKLKRVINNIVGNSIKYMDKPNGIITIELIDADSEINIKIGDNGLGIDEKSLPFIFDRFYRADASRNSKRGGTGLGLAIVKKIIEEHNGNVWAESSLGVGTNIYISLRKSNNK